MKKTLLLSVVASTMIMAGGDIAPVEPVVEAPAVEAAGWDFSGQGVLYYQTVSDKRATPVVTAAHLNPAGDMFSQENSSANVGLQLNATNSDLFAGIGAGVQLSGLGTLGLDEDVVSAVMQTGDGSLNSAAFTKAYLTYGTGNTSFKFGRQELPKALSPFAYSESWNVFKNTFGALTIVNTDIENTTLVGGYVMNGNDHTNLSDFNDINEDGVYMLTAQNKSIDGVTLTGTWYFAPDMFVTENANILWADAQFAVAGLNVGLQGGTVMGADDAGLGEDTTSFGAKVGGTFGGFDASVAYSTVDDGAVSVRNLVNGAVAKSPLYTQMILNNIGNNIGSDNDTFVVRAGAEALGGKFGVAYGSSDDNSVADNDYTELDVTYKTKIGENTTLFAAYVNQDYDVEGTNDFVRFWARYNF
ncbi:hypothetical protein ACFLR6_01435 [Campylobacterota bacterium]